MTPLTIIFIVASVLLGAGLLAVLAWLASTIYLNRIERRLARRKGIYRALVAELAVRERALLEPEIRRLGTLLDLEALEAVLEEQARDTAERPAWLLDVYDRLGLVDKYVDRLRSARRWRERAFAAELLGRVGNAKAVPALLETVQATRTEDGDVREIALRALARIGDPRAVDALVASLASADGWLAPRLADILTRHGSLVIEPLLAVLQQPGRPLARAWAANVLGEVRAAPAFAALARGLDDLEDEVRAKSATALGRLDDQRAIPYLLEHLLTDPAPFVRARIAAALGRFDDPEVIERLVRGLGDSAWWVRIRSIEALEQIGPRAEPSLLTALDDPNPEIRIRAAVGLERLGLPVTLVGRIVRGDGVPEATETLGRFAAAGARELLAELLLHPALPVRAAVVAASRRSGRGDLAPELAERARRDPEPTLRAAAFDALAAIGAHDAAAPALEALGDEDDLVRSAAIRLLVGLGGPEIVVRLRNRAAAPEPVTRAAAVRALGRLGTLEAKPDFLRLMSDEHPEVREAAALAAGEAHITALAPRLIGLLDDASAEVRLAAARGLGQVGDATALEPLAGAFAAADSALRDAIVSAVQRLDPGSVGGLLTTMAEGGDAAAKLSALRTFGRLRSAPVDAVERLAQDPDPMVRAAAFEAVPRVRRAVPDDLIAAGLQDADEEVRAATLDAACRIELVSPAVILALLERDLSAHVRQRAALAAGLLRVEGGEAALRATCRPPRRRRRTSGRRARHRRLRPGKPDRAAGRDGRAGRGARIPSAQAGGRSPLSLAPPPPLPRGPTRAARAGRRGCRPGRRAAGRRFAREPEPGRAHPHGERAPRARRRPGPRAPAPGAPWRPDRRRAHGRARRTRQPGRCGRAARGGAGCAPRSEPAGAPDGRRPVRQGPARARASGPAAGVARGRRPGRPGERRGAR